MQAIFSYGETCVYGESDMYVLLAGEVDIETDLGVVEARSKTHAQHARRAS